MPIPAKYASLPSRSATARNEQALQRGWEQIAKGKPAHKRKASTSNATLSYKPSAHPLQRLESLEEELRSEHGNTGATRWMIPYADLMTLLLGLFLMLMALATQHNQFLEGVTSNLMKDLQTQQAELNTMREALGLPPEPANGESADPNAATAVAEDTGIKVTQDERGLVITLLDSVLFTPGSATLSPEAKVTLSKVAEQLKRLPNNIQVEGHTDNTPIHTAAFPNNWYLSTARATQIVEYLITAHHFSPKRLSAAGYGEHHPVAENSSIEGKRQNRRVDIIVLNPQPGSAAAKVESPSSPASTGGTRESHSSMSTETPAVTPAVSATPPSKADASVVLADLNVSYSD